MVLRNAEPLERIAMLRRAVAGVPLPAVSRVLDRKRGHHPVARDLGYDRCGGDGKAEAVALHDGADGARKGRRDVAVDQCK